MKSAFLMLLFTGLSQAAVWVPTQKWNPDWEQRFSQWVASAQVKKSIFSCKGLRHCQPSAYQGISADCADVSYVFRLIFAYENSLPFSAKNPVATNSSRLQRFTQAMTRFDRLPAGPARVVAFANYLGDSLGTETLAANDSYPVALAKIGPGDFFMYKKKGGDNFIRHTYNVKNIDPKGNFNLIYATQASKAAGDPMYERVKALYNAPIKYRWGFRRFSVDANDIEAEKTDLMRADLNSEQYTLAADLKEEAFFEHVKSLLATEVESAESVVTAKLKELCEQVNERIDVVQKGLAHLAQTRNACMDYANFDAHSTPSRDGRLKAMMTSLKSYWDSHLTDTSLTTGTIALMDALFHGSPLESDQTALLEYCPVSYKPGVLLSLREIVRRAQANLLSSHPNDVLEARWGEEGVTRTTCHAFY